MKKLLSTLLVGLMFISLVACSPKKNEQAKVTTEENKTTEETKTTTSTATYKAGLGNVTMLSATNPTEDKEGKVEANTYFAGLVLQDGKIVEVKFDVAQNKVAYTAEGELKEATPSKTKVEKGTEYGMAKASAIGKEWFEQVAAFEAYAKGKTVDEVLNTPVKEVNDHKDVADVADLNSSVTISLTGFFKALKAASENLVDVASYDKFSLTSDTSISTKQDTEDKAANMTFNTYMALVLTKDGKIVLTQTDVAQNKAEVSSEGTATLTEKASKKLLKEEYGMKTASPIGKEWYEQNAAFEAYTVGKTVAEVVAMPVKEVNNHTDVPDVADLNSSVTISLTGHLNALRKAQ